MMPPGGVCLSCIVEDEEALVTNTETCEKQVMGIFFFLKYNYEISSE